MGGWNKGRHWPKEIRHKISESNRGKKRSKEIRLRMSLAHKGKKLSPEHCLSLSKPAWNKGIPHSADVRKKISDALKMNHPWRGKKHSEETRNKMSSVRKGIKFSDKHLKNLSESHKGHVHSKETRLKMSKKRKGKNHPLFGKPRSQETREKLAITNTGKKQSEETIEKRRETMKIVMGDDLHRKRASETSKIRWADSEYAKRVMKQIHVKPNFMELKIDGLLQLLFLGEYRYVGSGEVWIGGKNPDFINVNGQKKIIEFFGHRWHGPGDEDIRKTHFKQYGFETLVVWGNDLRNLESLKDKLRSFHEYLSLDS